jgi:hypothetical protein
MESKEQTVQDRMEPSLDLGTLRSSQVHEPLQIVVPPTAEYELNIERQQSKFAVERATDSPPVAANGRLATMLKAVARFKKPLIFRAQSTPLGVLQSTPPFTHLSSSLQRTLADKLTVKSFVSGAVMAESSRPLKEVMLLVSGTTVTVNHLGVVKAWFSAPAVFGEYEVVFDAVPKYTFKAQGEVTVYSMEAQVYEELLSLPVFRYAKIRDFKLNARLFRKLETFVNYTTNAVSSGEFTFAGILEHYRQIVPAIHSGIRSPLIDTAGWLYAVRRLPSNLTSTFIFFISSTIPSAFLNESLLSKKIVTAGRRRMIFNLSPGKDLILIREEFSDVLDFISCLCLHTVEAEKTRRKIGSPSVSKLLCDYSNTHSKETEKEQDDCLHRCLLRQRNVSA